MLGKSLLLKDFNDNFNEILSRIFQAKEIPISEVNFDLIGANALLSDINSLVTTIISELKLSECEPEYSSIAAKLPGLKYEFLQLRETIGETNLVVFMKAVRIFEEDFKNSLRELSREAFKERILVHSVWYLLNFSLGFNRGDYTVLGHVIVYLLILDRYGVMK